jgi:AcrR family transcriptional regulator
MAATDPTLVDAPAKAMRADARENREKLLRAASERFGGGGPDVSLELIARSAGVGIGTLYRHFPTREALIEAVYRNEVDQLCDSTSVLLAELAPDAALAEWMERFVGYLTTKRGLLGALKSVAASHSDLFPTTRRSTSSCRRASPRAGCARTSTQRTS